jgi:hypothetical protein
VAARLPVGAAALILLFAGSAASAPAILLSRPAPLER